MFNTDQQEKDVLRFWQDNDIFKKSIRDKNSPNFVFYEGPPTANAAPGIHHVEARAFKDIICRYKSMKGFRVLRKAGWDTHGLPVEIQVEKKLGLNDKKGIEEYGIVKFNKECQDSVWQYKQAWEEMTKRIGYWIDLDNPYITYDNNYIESVWWILKQIWSKGLLYQGYRVAPFCPRCGTTLSSHELAQGYKKVKEPSVYLKFKLTNQENTYLLIWTTTPWTIPGNVAVAINPNLTYLKVKSGQEKYILAKERISVLEEEKPEIIEEISGQELVGLEYDPLYPSENVKEGEEIGKVLPADFVTIEEGTGLVHIAPAFGEDDHELIKAQKEKFAFLFTVDQEGNMKTPGYPWDKKFVKEADPLIIKDLKERDILFKEELYEHDYPFCWRCDTPLIYYAQTSWFIKMTDLREKLLANNEKINWEPNHLKAGRFGGWLKEVKDWNLSRKRYWGTPLPVWQCQNKDCDHEMAIGSIKELKELSGQEPQDLHRPYIDEITFKCPKCGQEMKRVPEVIDCWFDSGSMPFAQQHYPFENKELVDQGEVFPADYISEAIDQTRGWFYTLLAISTLLEKGIAYKNVIVPGIVLDENGVKMSKSKGNTVVPAEVVKDYGADTVRFYLYTINQVDQPKKFSLKDLKDLHRKFFFTLENCLSFWQMYADSDSKKDLDLSQIENILDQWIISRLNTLTQKVGQYLEKYDVVSAARQFIGFVDDLSNWYIRRSRKRFQKPENKQEKEIAVLVLRHVLLETAHLLAPFTPFIAEKIYQELKGDQEKQLSIHLRDYPKPVLEYIKEDLEKEMKMAREVSTLALAERVENGIKVRQPLSLLKISKHKIKDNPKLLDLIKQEINVKEVIVDPKLEKDIELKTELTKELRQEGELREIIRRIQQMKKEAQVKPQDKVVLSYQGDSEITNTLKNNQDFIAKEVLVEFSSTKDDSFQHEKKVVINDQEIVLFLKIS